MTRVVLVLVLLAAIAGLVVAMAVYPTGPLPKPVPLTCPAAFIGVVGGIGPGPHTLAAYAVAAARPTEPPPAWCG